jgi:hypothetical protein
MHACALIALNGKHVHKMVRKTYHFVPKLAAVAAPAAADPPNPIARWNENPKGPCASAEFVYKR